MAIALASGRGFADAYFPGSGPTAHLTPTTPVVAGLVYRWLGIQSPAANAVLVGWSLSCFAVSMLLLNRLFRRLGASLPTRAGALGLICFFPVFLVHETLVFRFWEGQLSFAVMLWSLGRDVACIEAGEVAGTALAAALPIAAVALLNPVVGLATALAHAAALAMVRRWRVLVRDAMLVIALVAIPLAGWAAPQPSGTGGAGAAARQCRTGAFV